MTTRLRLGALSLMLVSCSTAAELEDGFSYLFVLSERDDRMNSVDLYEIGTKQQRFFDDYLELQPPTLCDKDDAGVSDWPYLWRHGVTGVHDGLVGQRGGGTRSTLDVSGAGLVALLAGQFLWTYSADGGVPLHADFGVGDEMVAFASDSLLWTSYFGPRLLNVSLPHDRWFGWPYVFDWRDAHPSEGGFDQWFRSSDAVLRDGTLIWTTGVGKTRAVSTSGQVLWEAPAKEGPILVTTDDVPIVTTDDGDLHAFGADGGVRWRAPLPAGTTNSSPGVVLDEGRYPSPFVPMRYSGVRRSVFLTRRADDGSVFAAIDSADAGNIMGGPIVVTADLDGQLFINEQMTSDEAALSAWTPALQLAWRVPSERLVFAPVLSKSGERLVTVDNACRVNLYDRRTGEKLASHKLLARPGYALPRLVNGVLYVVGSYTPRESVFQRHMQGRVRPDGSVIDVAADYGCYDPILVDTSWCPPVWRSESLKPRSVFVLYAFQVE